MKKKISIIALCVAVAGVIAYFPIKTALGGNDVMSQWGKILSDDSLFVNLLTFFFIK